MLDLLIKQYLRDYLKMVLDRNKDQMQTRFGAIMIKENEIERFLDDMWVFINKEKMQKDKTVDK
jgi:hypothetical protein